MHFVAEEKTPVGKDEAYAYIFSKRRMPLLRPVFECTYSHLNGDLSDLYSCLNESGKPYDLLFGGS